MDQKITLDSLTKKGLTPSLWLSMVIIVLMTAASISGVFFPESVYPDPELKETFLANDLVNLIIGLPYFLYSLFLIKGKKPLGLFLLPGAFIYVFYNYFAYLVARPYSVFSILNFVLVFLAGYSLFDFLSRLDLEAGKNSLEGFVPRKFSGWLLLAMGIGFLSLALYKNINAILVNQPLPLGEQVTSLADIVVSFLWIGGGILLVRKKNLGYVAGLSLLMAASSLFVGLVLFFFLAPLVAGRPFDWIEVVTVLGMGLICFIPTGLFWRGVARRAN